MTRKRITGAIAACAGAAAVLAGTAAAVPPQLISVGHEARHPTATFSAPRADGLTVYIASKPDRATDGSFLQENIETLDSLETSEIQAGRWLDDSQLDPGTYWVMLHASPDFASCYVGGSLVYDPACAQGFSDLVQLVIPKPLIRYAASVRVLKFLGRATLELRATPLGEDVRYRVCYRNAAKKRRCLSSTIDGFSWSSRASDDVSVNTRGLATFTTFTWFVSGKAVATKRARVR